jgi:hypothetical protein
VAINVGLWNILRGGTLAGVALASARWLMITFACGSRFGQRHLARARPDGHASSAGEGRAGSRDAPPPAPRATVSAAAGALPNRRPLALAAARRDVPACGYGSEHSRLADRSAGSRQADAVQGLEVIRCRPEVKRPFQ